MKPEEFIGRLCVCTHGKIGRVESYREDSQGVLYEGKRLFNGGRWQTRKPLILNGSDASNLEALDMSATEVSEAPATATEAVEVSEPRLKLTDAPMARRRRARKSTDDTT